MGDSAETGTKDAMIVLGMHRSGTSAMTRVLALAGAGLPSHMLPANTGNLEGHWEPQEVMDLNERVLAELDSSWDDTFGPRRDAKRKLPMDGHVPEAREIIRRNWTERRVLVLKEPRVSILYDLWREALVQEGYRVSVIFMARHPLEVADSLKSRDHLGRNRSLLLWATYVLAAEIATRNERRVFLRFTDLLNDPEAALDRIESGLDLKLPRRTWQSAAEIESFLKSEERHHDHGSEILPPGFGPIGRFHRALEAAAGGAAWDDDVSKELEDWLASLDRTTGPIIRQLERDLKSAAIEARRAGERSQVESRLRSETESRLADTEAALADRIARSEEETIEAAKRAEALEAELSALRERLQAKNDELLAHAAQADARAEALRQQLGDEQRSHAHARAENARIAAALEAARMRAAELDATLVLARRGFEDREATLQSAIARRVANEAALLAEIAGIESDARAAGRRVAQLQQTLSDAEHRFGVRDKEAMAQIDRLERALNEAVARFSKTELELEATRLTMRKREALAKDQLEDAQRRCADADRLAAELKEAMLASEASAAGQQSQSRDQLARLDAALREARASLLSREDELARCRAQFRVELETMNRQSAELARALTEAIAARPVRSRQGTDRQGRAPVLKARLRART